jgi:hypothetical protein
VFFRTVSKEEKPLLEKKEKSMKEAFLLPLASRPYDANKRVAITNEVNVIATRLIPIKTFKDFYNEATSEAVGAFDTELATANRADGDQHEMEQNAQEAQHNTLLNAWNSLTDAEKVGRPNPGAFARHVFVPCAVSAEEKEARLSALRCGFLAQHLAHALSTAAAIAQLYAAADTDNAAKRLSTGHTTALTAAIPAIVEALKQPAKIHAHSGAIVVLVDAIFAFWATVIQKNDAGKLASATITANQAILARQIKAASALDQVTDHCEAFENIHQRDSVGFADLLADSILSALEPALLVHVKMVVGRDKLVSWSRRPQDMFVRKVAEQANLFLAGHSTTAAAAATGPALAALQVEVAALRIENKRLAEHQRQLQRTPLAQQQQRAPQVVLPPQQPQAPPAQQQQQQQRPQQQQALRVSHPPGHPQYTGCAVRDANGRRCGAMDHGWRDHPS